MQVQGASPPASDDEEGPAAGDTGDDTTDTAPAAAHTLRSEHTQRWALAQQPPTRARSHDCRTPLPCNSSCATMLDIFQRTRQCTMYVIPSQGLILSWLLQGNELEVAALKEGEYVAVRRFVRLLERGGDAKVGSAF